jgi:hypothetical protein
MDFASIQICSRVFALLIALPLARQPICLFSCKAVCCLKEEILCAEIAAFKGKGEGGAAA